MAYAKLTQRFVRKAACPACHRKIDFFDATQRGFMVEIRRSGGKTFYQRYRDCYGRERQFKIGDAAAISVRQASVRARQVLAQATLGSDPHQQKTELRSIPTLREFVQSRYLPFVKSTKRSWRTDEAILRIHVIPRLGNLLLNQVSTEAIASLTEGMKAAGYASGTTNRVLIIVRYIFNLGRKWRVPGCASNPSAGLTIVPDVCRERFLTHLEASRLVMALHRDENQTAAMAIKLLLLTGGRRNEITMARWEYIEWERKTLLVPRAKAGRPRLLTLNTAAIDLLTSIERIPGNPYIFPSAKTGRPSPSLHFPWLRIRKAAGLTDIRLHDLRHSFASFLVNQGVSLYVVQGLLGHSQSRMTQRYAHLAQTTLGDAAELIPEILSQSSDVSSAAPTVLG